MLIARSVGLLFRFTDVDMRPVDVFSLITNLIEGCQCLFQLGRFDEDFDLTGHTDLEVIRRSSCFLCMNPLLVECIDDELRFVFAGCQRQHRELRVFRHDVFAPL